MVPHAAGEFAKKRFVRLASLGCGLVVIGLVLVLWAPRSAKLVALEIGLGALVTGRAILDKAEPWFEGYRGEKRVGTVLTGLEREGFVALHDLDKRYGNIDHAVLGPTGAFAIETKAWTGNVYARAGKLMRNGFDATGTVRQAKKEAIEMKRRLQDAGLDGWVEAVVVLTRAKLKKRPLEFEHVKVVRVEDLPAVLRAGRGTMTPAEIIRGRAAILRGDAGVRVTPISYEGPLESAEDQ